MVLNTKAVVVSEADSLPKNHLLHTRLLPPLTAWQPCCHRVIMIIFHTIYFSYTTCNSFGCSSSISGSSSVKLQTNVKKHQ